LSAILPQNLMGKSHFLSLHGKMGLLTFLLALASPLLGALSFRRLGLVQRFPQDWQPRLKWLHRLVSAAAGGTR
jgi:cytochrome b-561 domain-containing protein 2